MAKKKKALDAAIAMLIIHAENCEENAAISGDEGQWEAKAFNEDKARDYREAVKVLKAAQAS
jgi:hypothetical protein